VQTGTDGQNRQWQQVYDAAKLNEIAAARRQLGPACPTGIVGPNKEELNATLGDSPAEIVLRFNRDFPYGPLPTNVVGNFTEDTEAWSFDKAFLWLAAAPNAKIWKVLIIQTDPLPNFQVS
jgi:hypothetical protein